MVRKMGSFDVTQRTKDGFFNATELLKQWNKHSGQKKEIKEFFKLKNTNEFIQALIKEEDLHGEDSTYLKSRASRGVNAGTWMTPILFIKFSMWLNPTFEVQVIKFVYDNLIAFRHNAGDNYVGLTNAVGAFQNVNYPQLAKALNHIVFRRHESGIRNKATEQQLNKLTEIQKKLAFAVDMGYIRSFEELLSEMRKMWHLNKPLD